MLRAGFPDPCQTFNRSRPGADARDGGLSSSSHEPNPRHSQRHRLGWHRYPAPGASTHFGTSVRRQRFVHPRRSSAHYPVAGTDLKAHYDIYRPLMLRPVRGIQETIGGGLACRWMNQGAPCGDPMLLLRVAIGPGCRVSERPRLPPQTADERRTEGEQRRGGWLGARWTPNPGQVVKRDSRP